MILVAQTLRVSPPLWPFVERGVAFGMTYGLGPCGYDIRVVESFILWPKSNRRCSSLEFFDIPPSMAARVHDKSTWARRFVVVQNTFLEPGWRGYLTLELSNHSWSVVRIQHGMPIAQVTFELLDKPTDKPYRGKYYDQSPGAHGPLYDR